MVWSVWSVWCVWCMGQEAGIYQKAGTVGVTASVDTLC